MLYGCMPETIPPVEFSGTGADSVTDAWLPGSDVFGCVPSVGRVSLCSFSKAFCAFSQAETGLKTGKQTP